MKSIGSSASPARDVGEVTAAQRMQIALEASGTGTFFWNIVTDELWWDHPLDKLFGLLPGEAVRSLEQFVALVHPDDRAEVIERCQRCKHEAADFEMEFRVVYPDGSVHWLYDRGRTFTNSEGQAQYMTGACVDVTERRRAREALRRSEVFYRRTLESVPGFTFSTTEDGDCDYLSSQWSAYTGVEVTAHFGRAWMDALHPDDRARARLAWETAVAARRPYQVEYRIRRYDGQYQWFKANGCLVEAGDGQPSRWIGTILNIQDLKQAQAKVLARERELQSITDNSPDVIARFDRDCRHVFVSAAASRLTGKPTSAFIGRTNRELGMPDALCTYWESSIGQVFLERQPLNMQFEQDVDGQPRHFATRLVPEFDEVGEVRHVLAVARDVSESWEAEEALRRADQAKDVFLATLAHELRNPLAPIRAGIGVLQRGAGEREQARALSIMERQVHHMVQLVDDLLDLARIGQGKVVLRREVLPLQEVLEHAVETTRPLIEAQGHDFVWEPGDPQTHVHGDITRLAQVVGNLLTNAAKYTPPRGRVRLRTQDEGSDVCIIVEDSGVGIPREMLGRVFDRFVQVNQTLETSQGGMGIGLSVVRSLVEMHGGRVSADSAGPGSGTTIRVWLPRAQSDYARAAATAAPIATQGAAKRVLIVDDNADAAETLAMLAEMHGHVTRVANDGPAAISAAKEHEPQIVFMDIGMPGMSGYEVATHLRSLPGWQDRMIVALTGWGTEEDRAKSLAAGFDVHLAKPVDLAVVEKILAAR
ncbi:PAS domain-containing protein [Ramlibacter sp. XY19]|uniref:PAS domain-containing protein n=1 Tax=Ramlibacter paludis TaxID=2908000 RepID=UPI0023DC150B|nr:PAS domain-containing protein [Ramlibacter paludis]MCG2595748.1 PAS domain-containing protein [Ramlibacter paludis]